MRYMIKLMSSSIKHPSVNTSDITKRRFINRCKPTGMLKPLWRNTYKTLPEFHTVHPGFFIVSIYLFLFFSVALRPNAGHGLLILEVSRSHTTHHSRQDSSGRVISSSQRPLPDNTQHSQQTSMIPVGYETTISAGERPQTYALDRMATGTGVHPVSRVILTVSTDYQSKQR
jgi:hypothetical protein